MKTNIKQREAANRAAAGKEFADKAQMREVLYGV